MALREIRFIVGFGLFHGWLIALVTYTGQPPLGAGGPVASFALALAGGMASAAAFTLVPPQRIRVLSTIADGLVVGAPCLVLATFLAPTAPVALACCAVCGLLCGALHCLYGLASLAFPKHEFARIIALATVVASAVALAAMLVEEHLPPVWQALLLVALPLTAAFILRAAREAPGAAVLDRAGASGASGAPAHLAPRFVRLLVAVLIFDIVCRTCDVFATARFTGFTASSIAMLSSHIMAAGLLLAPPLIARKRGGLAFLYRFALPCAGAGFIVLALPIEGNALTHIAAVFLVGAGFEVINLVAWVLTSYAAQISPRPSRYFGLYVLVTYAAMLVGRLANLAALPYAGRHAAFLGLICIVALTIVVLVVLPEDQILLFEETLRLSQEKKAEGDAHRARCVAFAAAHGLTERETEVLDLLVRGRTLKVVAERLTISKGTAGTHIANIYRKCDVHTQQDLIDLFEQFDGSY